MSVIHKDKWPTVFSGFRAVTLNDLSRDISAGITLFTALLRILNCNRKH